MDVIVLPARAITYPLHLELPQFAAALNALEAEGYSRGNFKLLVRDAAKRAAWYHLPVTLDPEVAGRDNAGNTVQVNTLGRWLFGVPGYQGNARFIGWPEVPYVELPPACPEEVIRGLAALGPAPVKPFVGWPR